ncbi:Ig domain-containing protein [Corynebacterium callunae]|uniref:Ig domain-containing protein n=1 Tax=Corynebacterium callunae TaxID=1721 RepID=UPI0020003EC3|nr:Ig domain-containing protein [Corynebacterium callunae]MCK2200473.1 Ig domain-containing protein [Corynebacterium callunae]
MTKLYPYEVPDGIHPNAWSLLGFGLNVEQLNAISKHLYDDLGLTYVESESREMSFSWSVGSLLEIESSFNMEVGDNVDIQLPTTTAVRVTGGALPPGVKLDKTNKKIVGSLAKPGLYSVTVTIGPVVKYDPLGTPGGPNDPGIWIPINQPRQIPETNLANFPTTAADLTDFEKDQLLAELLAARDHKAIAEAE